MKYTESHEWISIENEIGTVGMTEYAQKELGEVVYVELPKVGSIVSCGGQVCVLESTKAASDVYSPVSGEVVEVNEKVKQDPSLINRFPENEGWLFKIAIVDLKECGSLLDSSSYLQIISE